MNTLVAQPAAVRQELDTQISTAKAYPRSIAEFAKEAIAMVTIDQDTAESCIYALPRKSANGSQSFLKGPSIRLAEIVASSWGNLHAATRIVENNGKTVKVEGVAWDLEKNLKIIKEVQRSITNKEGRPFSQDMQIVTANAASSIALRNAILSVVPKALVNKVYEAAVNFAIGDQTQLSKKIQALFDRFQKMGIGKEKILAYFQRKDASEVTVEDVEEMIGIGTSIKEKNVSIDDAFDLEKKNNNEQTSALNDKLSGEIS